MTKNIVLFTYKGIDITAARYLNHEAFFYEYRVDGKPRSCLHIDATFNSLALAMIAGVESVDDYFNGDPNKNTAT